MPYDFKRPHRHDYFEFFIFEKGGGSHFIDFTEYEIFPCTVHVVFPGQIHLLKRAGAKGIIILLTREFMDNLNSIFYSQLLQNNYTAPCISFSEIGFVNLLSQVAALEREISIHQFLSAELLKNHVAIILTYLLREYHVSANNSHTFLPQEVAIFQRFSALLEQYFADKPQVSFYASALAITPKTLNNCLKKISGKTCVELIQERTLTEAKRMLLYTDKSSKEIGYELNFKDNSYFTRFFNKLTGHTPSSFRAYWEKKYHS